jgi:hypothetical protein
MHTPLCPSWMYGTQNGSEESPFLLLFHTVQTIGPRQELSNPHVQQVWKETEGGRKKSAKVCRVESYVLVTNVGSPRIRKWWLRIAVMGVLPKRLDVEEVRVVQVPSESANNRIPRTVASLSTIQNVLGSIVVGQFVVRLVYFSTPTPLRTTCSPPGPGLLPRAKSRW